MDSHHGPEGRTEIPAASPHSVSSAPIVTSQVAWEASNTTRPATNIANSVSVATTTIPSRARKSGFRDPDRDELPIEAIGTQDAPFQRHWPSGD